MSNHGCLARLGTRFVIARNKWSALHIVGKVREGFLPEKKALYLTRDDALKVRNKMRSIHHAAYQVFEVPFTRRES